MNNCEECPGTWALFFDVEKEGWCEAESAALEVDVNRYILLMKKHKKTKNKRRNYNEIIRNDF